MGDFITNESSFLAGGKRGCSVAKPRCSPEATALPGGGTVRGHTPSSQPNDAASVPSDRSGGPEFLRTAWPPVPPRALPTTPGGLLERRYRRADFPASSTPSSV